LIHSPHFAHAIGKGVRTVAGLGESNVVSAHDVHTAVDGNNFESVVSLGCVVCSKDLNPGSSALTPNTNADALIVDEDTRKLDEGSLAHEFVRQDDIGGIFSGVGWTSSHASTNSSGFRDLVTFCAGLEAVSDHPDWVFEAFAISGKLVATSVISNVVAAFWSLDIILWSALGHRLEAVEHHEFGFGVSSASVPPPVTLRIVAVVVDTHRFTETSNTIGPTVLVHPYGVCCTLSFGVGPTETIKLILVFVGAHWRLLASQAGLGAEGQHESRIAIALSILRPLGTIISIIWPVSAWNNVVTLVARLSAGGQHETGVAGALAFLCPLSAVGISVNAISLQSAGHASPSAMGDHESWVGVALSGGGPDFALNIIENIDTVVSGAVLGR